MAPELRRTPDYLLERAAAGDLPPAARAALADALARGSDRLAAIARDNAETLARIPPRAFAAEVAARTAVGRPARRTAWLLVPSAAAAALALVLLLPSGAPRVSVNPPDSTRVKGLAPHLVVHRSAGAGDERLPAGALARPGDLLQLGYVAAGRPYGAILSIDGRGVVTLHWPVGGALAGALQAQREVLLPLAFRLDDAPGFERFLLVTSDAPFAIDDVLRAARGVAGRPDADRAPLPLDHQLDVSSTLVLKEVR